MAHGFSSDIAGIGKHGSPADVRLAIACRGSPGEGLGHLFRAASFATEAARHCRIRIVALAEPSFLSIFRGLDCPIMQVSDEAELAAAVTAEPADAVVLDMVELGGEAFAAIRRSSAVLASISPVFRRASGLDLLFTRSMKGPDLDGVMVHSGLDFAIVNAHCRPIPDNAFEAALAMPSLPIMVSFGGADADNHSRQLLEILSEVDTPLLIWLMLGDGYAHPHDGLVEALAAAPHHEMIMARTNRSMWRIAQNCALAILSSGMSTLEAMYAGLPVISVRRGADPANEVNTAYDAVAFDGGSVVDGSCRQVRALVEQLDADRGSLRARRALQRGLVSGDGARNVLAALLRHIESVRSR